MSRKYNVKIMWKRYDYRIMVARGLASGRGRC